ncbi:MAG TPA: EAL domain-containing protein [Rhodocyclaceae bacterium]|nr:EAL domain-containing protein [Rhodocyclaceae bacterium]
MNRFKAWLAHINLSGGTTALLVLICAVLAVVLDLVGPRAQLPFLLGGILVSLLIGALVSASLATEKKAQKAKLSMELDTWEHVFENATEAIVLADAERKILRVNPAFGRLTGYSALDVVGKTPGLLRSSRHNEQFFAAILSQLAAVGFWQGGVWQKRKSAEEFFSMVSVLGVKGRDGKTHRYVYLMSDVTEQRQRTDDFAQFAYQDILTGLPNRYLLHDRLANAVEVARRDKNPLALMFIDLDRFKVINDSLGYEVGDLLLIETARRFKQVLRGSDTLARLGGDEFVILLPEAGGIGSVTDIAEELNQVMAPPMQVKGRDIHIGASIGIALYPRDGESALALMKNADTAMYRSKAEGPNGFRFFDHAMNASAVERMELESALRRALQRKEFVMHYQPKINLSTGQNAGAEALIRWISPEHGPVAPSDFIPLAEETGLITKIGDWVLDEVCRQLAEWRDKGIAPQQVAVNVSARQFLDERFSEKVVLILEKYKLEPSSLELELTEGTMMANPEAAVKQLLRLQALGVVVSVDDFGTGYSSLTYLKRLPIGTIKVDQSFVRSVNADDDNAAIVAAIQGMAEALGMTTVAEGIETEAEEDHLRESGCTYGQGYHYSKPLSVEDFERWMAERNQAFGSKPV